MSSLSFETVSSAITAIDESMDLTLFSNQTAPDVKPPLEDLPVRGVVFDKESKEVVLPGCFYTKEVTPSEPGLTFPMEVSKLVEGTALRLFFYKRQWRIATYRKLDAYESYWSSRKSFGELFEDAIRELTSLSLNEFCQSYLHPHNQYMFLLQSTRANHIVCEGSDKLVLYFMGRHGVGEDTMEIPRLPKIIFDNVEDLEKSLNELDSSKFVGFLYNKPKGPVLKFTSPSYAEQFDLRGNVSNLLIRYLQMKKEDPKAFARFLTLYKSDKHRFNHLEEILVDVKKYLFQTYKYRYILKHQIQVPPHLFYILKMCHNWYYEDFKTRKVTPQVVSDFVDAQNPNSIYRFYKDFST